MYHTTLRQAALGVIAILAVVLMWKSVAPQETFQGSAREKRQWESTPDSRE